LNNKKKCPQYWFDVHVLQNQTIYMKHFQNISTIEYFYTKYCTFARKKIVQNIPQLF